MNMQFKRKLPIPQEIKEEYPASEFVKKSREEGVKELKEIFEGKSDKFVLVIGPCSADREDAVLEYIHRLRKLQEQVKDEIFIVPRIYTNKPRTTGEGYKGMLHQPNPTEAPDLLKGLISIRKMHMRAVEETGFCCADEMLYPENHRYLSDILGYVAVGARSTENQQHRLTASGLDIPVGMKNPTAGDIGVMMNSIKAAQGSHTFIYRGWDVTSAGNPHAHAILRGFVDEVGKSHANYHYEDLIALAELYEKSGLKNPAALVDTNHSNSGKKYLEQPRIAKEVLHSRRYDFKVKKLVKGLMIESYLEDGAQGISADEVYGKSITDPCLGWEKTERLVLDIAESL